MPKHTWPNLGNFIYACHIDCSVKIPLEPPFWLAIIRVYHRLQSVYLAFLLAVCHDKDLILCLAHCHRTSKFESLRRVEECSPILGLKAVPLADLRRTKVKEILALINSVASGRSVHFDGSWSQVVQWGWLPLVAGSRKHHVSLLQLVMD